MWRIFCRLQRSFFLSFAPSLSFVCRCSIRCYFIVHVTFLFYRNLLSVVSSSIRRAARHTICRQISFSFAVSVCLSVLFFVRLLLFVLYFYSVSFKNIICYFICCWFFSSSFFGKCVLCVRELKTTTANQIYLHDHVNWTATLMPRAMHFIRVQFKIYIFRWYIY